MPDYKEGDVVECKGWGEFPYFVVKHVGREGSHFQVVYVTDLEGRDYGWAFPSGVVPKSVLDGCRDRLRLRLKTLDTLLHGY